MLQFYSLVALLSVLVHCVLQVQANCPSVGVIKRVNTTDGSSSMWLGDDGYEGYLEICTYTNTGTHWRPVCGAELWTNTEARVACNQLGYPNTTTLAITGGLCSAPPDTITKGIEIHGCAGTETNLNDCQSSEGTCSEWAGIICTSSVICQRQICSNNSYCSQSSSCSNCTIPQGLNCICYGECSPPCMNGARCVYNNTCQCPPHWTGEHCEQSLLSTTYTNTHTDRTLPRSTSTCNVTCMNGGTCSGINSCICMTGYDGLQCEHKKGESSLLYIVISILAFLLFLIILIITVVFCLLYPKAFKRKMRTLNNETSENLPRVVPTLSEDTTKPISDTTLGNSQNSIVNFLNKDTYPITLTFPGENKTETSFMIPNNNIYTGNYDLVGPVEEDHSTLIYNGNFPEYAEVNDCLVEKPVEMPSTTLRPDYQPQEYSELNHAYKEEQKCLTFDRHMKDGQLQQGHYSKFNRNVSVPIHSIRCQHLGETYSSLGTYHSDSGYQTTESKDVISDTEIGRIENTNFRSDSAVDNDCSNRKQHTKEGSEAVCDKEFLSSKNGLLDLDGKSSMTYDHCTLKYNPQYNCN